MSYMEQQMQNYIESGLGEADRCYTKIAELERQNDELVAKLHRIMGVWQHCAGRVHSIEEIAMMGGCHNGKPTAMPTPYSGGCWAGWVFRMLAKYRLS